MMRPISVYLAAGCVLSKQNWEFCKPTISTILLEANSSTARSTPPSHPLKVFLGIWNNDTQHAAWAQNPMTLRQEIRHLFYVVEMLKEVLTKNTSGNTQPN
jgi:hypothetical protein